MTPTPTSTLASILISFARDVEIGLKQTPKSLPSKYFYDAEGDRLFQQIMAMPDYYLTDAEFEIFHRHQAEILEYFGQDFQLVELGAGDGEKTQVLLAHFCDQSVAFSYRPVDISGNILAKLHDCITQRWPSLRVDPVEDDWFAALTAMAQETVPQRRVVMFLGANIGNLERDAATDFLHRLRNCLGSDDRVLIGFDLRKKPTRILAAYNDATGYTADFNLNLLHRINRELGANFAIDQFHHWQIYDPVSGACRSRIVSNREQWVRVAALDKTFHFQAWEAIDMEVSMKYSLAEIEALAIATGFSVIHHFTDSQNDFLDTLWGVM